MGYTPDDRTLYTEMNRPLLIYVAGPYSASTDERILANVNTAIHMAMQVYRKGHFPFIPHLTHYVDKWGKRYSTPLTYEQYLEWDDVILARCDAILHYAHSKGADLELQRAMDLNLFIFRDIAQIPQVTRYTVHMNRTRP